VAEVGTEVGDAAPGADTGTAGSGVRDVETPVPGTDAEFGGVAGAAVGDAGRGGGDAETDADPAESGGEDQTETGAEASGGLLGRVRSALARLVGR
jgi:hypothetical protein